MNNIIFQTTDGAVYKGELTYFGKEELSVKNLYKFKEFYDKKATEIISYPYETGDVWFYTNKIIWYNRR